MVGSSVEAPDDRHRLPVHEDHPGRSRLDARQASQLQRQHFAARHAALVPGARELAECEGAVFFQDAALRAQAAERGRLAEQVLQVLGRLLAELHRAGGRQHRFELQQRRGRAFAGFDAAQVALAGIPQSQRTDAAVVVDRAQVVQLGQGSERRILLALLGMRAGYDAPAPAVGLGVGEREEERGVVVGRGLAQLVAGGLGQVGGNVEVERVRQPAFPVGKLRKLAWAVAQVDELANGMLGRAEEDVELDLCQDGRLLGGRHDQNEPASGVRGRERTRCGSLCSMSARPTSSCDASKSASSLLSSPKTCRARAMYCSAVPAKPSSIRRTVLTEAPMRSASIACDMWRRRRAREMFSPNRTMARSTGRGTGLVTINIQKIRFLPYKRLFLTHYPASLACVKSLRVITLIWLQNIDKNSFMNS